MCLVLLNSIFQTPLHLPPPSPSPPQPPQTAPAVQWTRQVQCLQVGWRAGVCLTQRDKAYVPGWAPHSLCRYETKSAWTPPPTVKRYSIFLWQKCVANFVHFLSVACTCNIISLFLAILYIYYLCVSVCFGSVYEGFTPLWRGYCDCLIYKYFVCLLSLLLSYVHS